MIDSDRAIIFIFFNNNKYQGFVRGTDVTNQHCNNPIKKDCCKSVMNPKDKP